MLIQSSSCLGQLTWLPGAALVSFMVAPNFILTLLVANRYFISQTCFLRIQTASEEFTIVRGISFPLVRMSPGNFLIKGRMRCCYGRKINRIMYRLGRLFFQQLLFVQFKVNSFLRHEGFVAPLLHNFTPINNQYLVCIFNCRHAVCY